MFVAENVSATAPKFTISVNGGLLSVVLSGNWNLTSEGRYLNTLAEHMNRLQGQQWGVVVDMRNWQLSNNLFQKNVANVHLDRTGQVCECWIVNNLDQASELQPFIESLPGIRFKRVFNNTQANHWLSHFNL